MSASPIRRSASRLLGERGAAAVEFALVVPLLLLLLVGIVETSKALNAQATLSAAAREGARALSQGDTVASALAAVQTAGGSLGLSGSAISISPATCVGVTTATTVTVTVTYHQSLAAGLFGSGGITITGKAAMRCAA